MPGPTKTNLKIYHQNGGNFTCPEDATNLDAAEDRGSDLTMSRKAGA
jgi:hypothetical protein